MDGAETSRVLTIAAALDPYGWELTDEIVMAWAVALQPLDAVWAQRAVLEHYRRTEKRVSIAAIIALAGELEAAEHGKTLAEARAERRREDREAVREIVAAQGEPQPARDRTRDIQALIASHRNWSTVGDLATRRKQARWNPDLERRYREALVASARERPSDTPDSSGTQTGRVE
jgi:hypothetical protein